MSDAADMGYNHLAVPFEGDFPMGQNARLDAALLPAYRSLKDLRSLARREERNQEQDEDPGRRLQMRPEWRDVRAAAEEMLANATKDLEIASWWAEAAVRIDGIHGLRASLKLISQLVTNFGDALYSVDDETPSDKVAPFAALNGIGQKGTLIPPLQLSSLVPGYGYGEHTLWQYELGQDRDAIVAALSEQGSARVSAHAVAISESAAALEACDAAFAEAYGADSPPTSSIRNILEDMAAAMRVMAGHLMVERDSEASEKDAAMADIATSTSVTAPPAMQSGMITNRDEAFRRLLEVAKYFRKAEPHSPIAPALETLVRRGKLDFVNLLAELIPDEHTRRAVLTTAGIQDDQAN